MDRESTPVLEGRPAAAVASATERKRGPKLRVLTVSPKIPARLERVPHVLSAERCCLKCDGATKLVDEARRPHCSTSRSRCFAGSLRARRAPIACTPRRLINLQDCSRQQSSRWRAAPYSEGAAEAQSAGCNTNASRRLLILIAEPREVHGGSDSNDCAGDQNIRHEGTGL